MNDKNAETKQCTTPNVERSSSLKEPDFRTEKVEWIAWNMIKYGNTIDIAYQLLRQKEIVCGF